MENSVVESGTVGAKVSAAGTDDDELTQLVQWFEESEELTATAREKAQKCRDYYDGIQLTALEIATLQGRNQPPIVNNRIKRKINFLLGNEMERRSDPKAFPRNVPEDEAAADAATDALRYVQEDEDMPTKCSDVFENMMIEGYGGIEILYNAQKGCVEVKGWAWDRLFYDPFSSKHDFTDATYVGGIVWMNENIAQAKYPDKKAVLEGTVASARSEHQNKGETFDDKPRNNIWVDFKKRPRVRIVQIYWNDGKTWKWAHYTKGGFLKGPMDVAFLNEDGESECPLLLQAAYVNRENERYGEVAELLDIQDEVNKRRSKLLHSISVRQVIAEAGAVDNVERARTEVAKPDGFIEVAPGKRFDIEDGGNMAAGQAELLAEAKNEMEIAGPNAALMGKQGKEASGRAILASQQGGLTELARVFGRYKQFKVRAYRQIWNRVKQFWTEEKWVRVTDNGRDARFVGFNTPEKVGDALLEQAKAKSAPPEMIAEIEKDIETDPSMQVPTGKMLNNVGKMDVDIIIDESPDTVSIQVEQFDQLVGLAQAGVVFAPEDYIEMSQLHNKEKMLQRLKERQDAAQGQNQIPPEVQKLQFDEIASKVDKTKAETHKIQTEVVLNEIQIEHAPDEHHQAMNPPPPKPNGTGAAAQQ